VAGTTSDWVPRSRELELNFMVWMIPQVELGCEWAI
jgi:hypothetical protein